MARQSQLHEYAGDSDTIMTITNGIAGAANTMTSSSTVVPNMSEFDASFARLKEKPHDPEGWRRLVDLAESSGEIDKIRAAFEALLKQYPNTVCFWSAFLSPSLQHLKLVVPPPPLLLFPCNDEYCKC